MSAIVTSFSVEPEVSEKISQLSNRHGGNRSRWFADFLHEFADDWSSLQELKEQVRITREVAPHVRELREHCRAMYTGRKLIRDWDKEIMGLLRAGYAIGESKSPDDIYIFNQMIDQLINELQAAQAANWSKPEAFDI